MTGRTSLSRRRIPALALALALAATAVAGCSDDDNDGSSTTTTTTTTTTPGAGGSTTTVAPGEMVVQVFFLDEAAFNIGRPPYTRPVERTVSSEAPARAALDQLFAGPTDEERADGLTFVGSDATGISELTIADGIARVHLEGGCASGGSTFTVADQIAATLRQFESVRVVKVYDPEGTTGRPDDASDSIPACLEP